MEDSSFWRDRESRFLALATPRLHAMRSEADVAQVLADISNQLLRALKAADYPIENVTALARGAGHVAGLVLRREYICQWNISGDSNDTFARDVAIDRFRNESALSARGAGLVAIGVSDDEAVDRWIDALGDPESPYWKRSGGEWIDDLAAASAALCDKLAGRAYDADRAEAEASEQGRHALSPPFLDNAAIARAQTRLGPVLQRYRALTGLTVELLAEELGVSKSTVHGHLNKGIVPRPDHLAKYASLFRTKLGYAVSIEDLLREALATDIKA